MVKIELLELEDFLKRTTRKLENSKEVNRDDKRSYEEAVQQEKTKLSRTERRR